MALIFLQSAAFPSSINQSDKVADYFAAGCPEDGFTDDVAKSYDKLLAGTYSSIFLTAFHILLGTLTSTPDEINHEQCTFSYLFCSTKFGVNNV